MPNSRFSVRKVSPFVILLLAFVLQISYLVELRATFPASFVEQPFCGVDAQAHLERASGLLAGSLPGNDTFYFIPLYPLFLALLNKFVGVSLLLPVYVQILLQLVGISALYSIGRLVFSPLVGGLAALGLATYNYYIFYVPCLDQALLTVPLFTAGIFFLFKFNQCRKSIWLLVAGMVLAAAALSRPTILITIPVIIFWLVWLQDSWRHRITDAVVLLLPFVIFISPITWHNYQISGRFILLSDNFGVNLFTGNNPDAPGWDSLAHIQSQPAVFRFLELTPRLESGETTLTAEVLRYITEQPGDWVALMATKTWLWFGEADEPLVSPFFPLLVSQSPLLSSLPLEWRAVMIVSILGILLVPTRRRSRRYVVLLWMVYGLFSLATIFFFVQLRFRLPFSPFVLLFAASLLAGGSTLKHNYPVRFWTALVILLLLYPVVPTLWLFILLFAGIGLWPREWTSYQMSQSMNGQVKGGRRSFAKSLLFWGAVCAYALAVGLWVKASEPDVSQTIDLYLGPPLAGTGIVGQTFKVDCDSLNRIDLTLGVLNDQHDQPVTFYLATDLTTEQILYSETFAGTAITDYQQKSFRLPPIADSAGRTFFLFLSSPTSTPQNGITVRGYSDTPVDRYPAGQAVAGRPDSLQPIQADIAFKAFCEMSFSERLWRVVRDMFP